MERVHTKEAAEALLRELPSVRGAFVREDINGHPREIHLLVGPGPNVKLLAQDVRDLLEERLQLAIDHRIISIAQLAEDVFESDSGTALADAIEFPQEPRLRFVSVYSEVSEKRLRVRVQLEHGSSTHEGEAVEVDLGTGRLRASATATLRAATAASVKDVRLELDGASQVKAFDREYILVSVLGRSGAFGRKLLQLAGAHAIEEDVETAASLATLKAINRVLARILVS
jgi:hypothetical protein